jgi:hypothetical protein
MGLVVGYGIGAYWDNIYNMKTSKEIIDYLTGDKKS